MNIGLLMVSHENDVLERTLAANCEFVDCFYVLDGTVPHGESEAICKTNSKCAGYQRDQDLPYDGHPRDGWRQALYEQAAAEHGRDNWFLLLHGDEVWTGLPGAAMAHCDGFTFRLPFYFPREGEPWDYRVHPLDQLRWSLGPGSTELRMFRGGENVNFDPQQHFNVTPSGLQRMGACVSPIRHYLYRSPDCQQERLERHLVSGFDPDNYRHVATEGAYWSEDRIRDYQLKEPFRELTRA